MNIKASVGQASALWRSAVSRGNVRFCENPKHNQRQG
jgi:hypothetical protein